MMVFPSMGNQWKTIGGSFGFLNSSWLKTLNTTAITTIEATETAIATLAGSSRSFAVIGPDILSIGPVLNTFSRTPMVNLRSSPGEKQDEGE